MDKGEAPVIQTAIDQGLDKVWIDKKAGRRIARLHGLMVAGSIGIHPKTIARRRGFSLGVDEVIVRLCTIGIWMGNDIEQFLRSEA